MKIYVIGSTSFMKEMVGARDELQALGIDGWIHPDYDAYVNGEKLEDVRRWQSGEGAALKKENDYLRQHYKHILMSDAVLVVNGLKEETEDYIGGNALMEMGQAYVNDKKIFILGGIPTKLAYTDEIQAMEPICLEGSLQNILKYV